MSTRCLAACLVLLGLLPGCKITPDEQPGATGAPMTQAPPAPPPASPEAEPPTQAAPADAPADVAETAGGLLPPPVEVPPPPVASPPSGPPVTVAELPAEPPAADRAATIQRHLEAVQAWLLRTHRAAVIISRPETYAWLTAGQQNQIAADAPAAAIAVLPGRALLVASSDIVNAAREPLRGLGWQAGTYRWDLGRDPAAPVRAVRPLAGSGVIAADEHRPGTEYAGDDLAALRLALDPFEQARVSLVAHELAEVVSTEVDALAPAATEHQLAAALEERLEASGLTPRDIRVTALTRLGRDGLAPPGDAALGAGFAVHVTAARHGLCATVGRTVMPPPGNAAVADGYGIVRAVAAAMLGKIAVGAPLRDIFASGARRAAELGAPGLFERVSPGSADAFDPERASLGPNSVEKLQPGQVVTITVRHPRAYLAETVLVLADGVRILTAGPWPSPAAEVNGRLVPVPTLRGAEAEVAEAEVARALAMRRQRMFGFLEKVVAGAIEQAVAEVKPTEPKVEAEPDAPAEAEPAPAATEG